VPTDVQLFGTSSVSIYYLYKCRSAFATLSSLGYASIVTLCTFRTICTQNRK